MNAEYSLNLFNVRDVANIEIGENKLETSQRHILIPEFDIVFLELVVIKVSHIKELADIIDCYN